MDDNRKRALAAALQQIERQFGKGAIMRMGDGTHNNDIQTVSTGSLTLPTVLPVGQTYVARFGELMTLSVTMDPSL